MVSLFISTQHKWACFRFFFFCCFFWKLYLYSVWTHDTHVATEKLLPYTDLVFKSSQETCSPSWISFGVSGKAEEVVTHLLCFKEMVLSIDLQETFLPRGHALQPQRGALIFVLLQTVWLDCRPLWSIDAWRDVLHVCSAVFSGHYIDKTISTSSQPWRNSPFRSISHMCSDMHLGALWCLNVKDVLTTFKKLRGSLVSFTKHSWTGCLRTCRDGFVCLLLQPQAGVWEAGEWKNRDAKTLCHGKSKIHFSPFRKLAHYPARDAVEVSTGEHSLEGYTLFWMFFLGIQAWRQQPVKRVQFPI